MHFVSLLVALAVCLTWSVHVDAHALNIHFRPSKTPPKQAHKILDHGRGSKLLVKCGVSDEPCGPAGASKSDCERFQCCWDKTTSTCTKSSMHIIKWNTTECYYSGDLTRYQGAVSTTDEGISCQNWSKTKYWTGMSIYWAADIEKLLAEEGDHNYCRSFFGYPPLCVVVDNYGSYDMLTCAANIPKCDEEDHQCFDDDFRCVSDGSCISGEDVCDIGPDCSDGSDEADCDEEKCVGHGKFWCAADDACIPSYFMCDAMDDCSDGADEDFVCDRAKCTSLGMFNCADNSRCYSSYSKCNGETICDDGSDELGCDAHMCEWLGHGSCDSGDECFSPYDSCDGSDDCSDGSDEICDAANCDLKMAYSCADNSDCYYDYQICDGIEYCDDGTDEAQTCDADLCSSLGRFHCTDDSRCLEYARVCDGTEQCADGSDELVCDVAKCESLGRFGCADEQLCIEPYYVCDGSTFDCVDNSDESECDADMCESLGKFHCANNICVNHALVCNGDDDCGDSSDELDCDVCLPEITSMLHGTVSCTDANNHGSECDMICHEGYTCSFGHVQHSHETTCIDGSWTQAPIEGCIPITCDIFALAVTANVASITCTGGAGDNDNDYESTCVFECEDGFVVDARNSITCNSDGDSSDGEGEWSDDVPICVSKSITCDSTYLSTFNNNVATVTCTGASNNELGSTCTFGCEANFEVLDHGSITCLEDGDNSDNEGKWDNTAPQCVSLL